MAKANQQTANCWQHALPTVPSEGTLEHLRQWHTLRSRPENEAVAKHGAGRLGQPKRHSREGGFVCAPRARKRAEGHPCARWTRECAIRSAATAPHTDP